MPMNRSSRSYHQSKTGDEVELTHFKLCENVNIWEQYQLSISMEQSPS